MTTVRDGAKALGISVSALRDLIRLGFVGHRSPSGRYELTSEEIAGLSATPWVGRDHAPALVVCVDPARPDSRPSNHRTQSGWDPGLGPDDRVQLDGVRQWWPCRAPVDVEVVVVTNNGWVLHAYEVVGDPSRNAERARWSFDVVPEETQKARAFIGHRLPPKPGPVAYPLS